MAVGLLVENERLFHCCDSCFARATFRCVGFVYYLGGFRLSFMHLFGVSNNKNVHLSCFSEVFSFIWLVTFAVL